MYIRGVCRVSLVGKQTLDCSSHHCCSYRFSQGRGPVICQTTAALLTAPRVRRHEPDGQHGPTWCLGGLDLPEVRPLIRGCPKLAVSTAVNCTRSMADLQCQHATFHALLAQL